MQEVAAIAKTSPSPGILAIIGMLVVVVSIPLTLWLTIHKDDRWLGSGGFALSVAGLLFSVVGFGLTLWQLNRTNSATEAVGKAIVRLRRDLGSLDVLTELRSAAEAAGEAQAHLSNQRWASALLSYNKIRHCLYKALAVDGALNAVDSETAKDFIAHALGACSELEMAADNPIGDVSNMSGKLRELEGFLVTSEYRTKDSFGG